MNGEVKECKTENVDVTFKNVNKEVFRTMYIELKRIVDFFIALIGITITSPIFIIVAIAIMCTSKGSAIYRHKRIGKNGKHIYLYKFRTMVSDANNFDKYFTKEQKEEFLVNFKLDNDPRITKVGKILRKTSLDELPQLFNILKGDMALIGPRPVVDGEIEKFGSKKDIVLSILPGLTGWWACNGRSCTSYAERVKLESYYAENVNLLLDIKCFFKTIIVVIKREGAK